jgi:hypothetical protein
MRGGRSQSKTAIRLRSAGFLAEALSGFRRIRGCFCVDFVKAFETVPREMLFKVLARLGFPPKIINLVRVFHENVTLRVDLDDVGNTIIIKY